MKLFLSLILIQLVSSLELSLQQAQSLKIQGTSWNTSKIGLKSCNESYISQIIQMAGLENI